MGFQIGHCGECKGTVFLLSQEDYDAATHDAPEGMPVRFEMTHELKDGTVLTGLATTRRDSGLFDCPHCGFRNLERPGEDEAKHN